MLLQRMLPSHNQTPTKPRLHVGPTIEQASRTWVKTSRRRAVEARENPAHDKLRGSRYRSTPHASEDRELGNTDNKWDGHQAAEKF